MNILFTFCPQLSTFFFLLSFRFIYLYPQLFYIYLRFIHNYLRSSSYFYSHLFTFIHNFLHLYSSYPQLFYFLLPTFVNISNLVTAAGLLLSVNMWYVFFLLNIGGYVFYCRRSVNIVYWSSVQRLRPTRRLLLRVQRSTHNGRWWNIIPIFIRSIFR